MILNPGVRINPGAAAGAGATAALAAVDVDGLRGLASVTTGASGMAAGALATIQLAQPVIADVDVYTQALLGGVNGGVFAGVEILVTAFPPPPPAGITYFPLAQLQNGQVTGFGIGVTGPLLAATTYRFSWRVLT
jgi:hypothetical protein